MTASADQPTLATERLRVRPFTLADAAEVRALAGAWEIADTTLTIPHPYPLGAAETWIATHRAAWNARQRLTYAIVEEEHGTRLGAVSLVLAPASASAELGYWVAVPAWGRGYATEAAATVCDPD